LVILYYPSNLTLKKQDLILIVANSDLGLLVHLAEAKTAEQSIN